MVNVIHRLCLRLQVCLNKFSSVQFKERKGKERKGTKSHKLVIFHVVVEKHSVSGF